MIIIISIKAQRSEKTCRNGAATKSWESAPLSVVPSRPRGGQHLEVVSVSSAVLY